jgi:hypothetical protein
MSLNERQITDREIKALQIAAKHKLTRKGNVWFVPSQAGKASTKLDQTRKRRAAPVLITSLETLAASTSLPLNTSSCASTQTVAQW